MKKWISGNTFLFLTTVDQVDARIKSINSMASVVHTEMSRVDLETVLDLHAYDGKDEMPAQVGSLTQTLCY